ncbi:o-succinylbenzoate--CoA ligase [Halobacillus karajensis]|uniref:2-succinylbenzoate--CoA ligase n=1 Tax=Halobacillus karajensis TaxID=195088 RepID=A0A024P9X6_9BACI|nr:o-succinylbenzoate--CoA ligase [Halobacillus karajensis]CDQ21382.1 Long-chain-fatty-acid--CoA ligase FadD13 [Halobacillus karajensis]CDQ25546.1 Long-chain-fatty-acid--CoA ligase FadD13 [Halobacillus karajensis]CDQ25817.1 Long-chain-fatty-acid--CoA ligase FadD13 [Halobacillus karajensis]
MGERIPHWLDKQADLNPDRLAIETADGRRLSFAQLRNKSRGMAHALIEEGVQQGDHVALLSNNHPLFPIFIHAISYIGATAILINTRLTPEEISYQLNDAQVSHFYVEKTCYPKALETVENMNIPVKTVEGLNLDKTGSSDLQTELHMDDVYTMMYTSGTTGNPKAVMHTYGNHWHSAIASALNLGFQQEDKWLICLPLFHVGGFSVLMKSVIYGMPTLLLEKFDVTLVHRSIMDKGITHVSVVTVMLQRLLEELGDQTYPDYFRCMLLGGGPVPENLLQETAARKIPVFQTYGMTETSSQVATLSPESAFTKLGSAGKALSTAQLHIDSEKNGEIGEIVVQGPMVSKGYYNRPAREEAALWTGDLGYKDEDGFLYVVDRVNDVIISGGENIYPAEVESVLSALPGIREAGVTGCYDQQWGEVPEAYLVKEKGADLTEEKVMEWCEERLAKFKWPVNIYWVDELPRNASNKILRRRLPFLFESRDTKWK